MIDAAEWVRQIRAGNPRALARAATAIENRHPAADALRKALFPHTGHATILGVTGAPGAGKSTFVDALTRNLRNEAKQVAILAVDPTSPYSGGAILGDRIRMQSHHADPGVFIRSMATRGNLGGLALATTDLALLLDAAGRDAVIVETVGVGQDEVEIARLADVTLVVLVPNMGDDVQSIKAGIMEIADIFVINKADQPGADRLEREIKANQSLGEHRADGWIPPILRTVANQGQGIAEVLAAVREYQSRGGRKETRAVETWTLRLRDMLRDRLTARLAERDFAEAAQQVATRQTDPYTLVDNWIAQCLK